MLITINETCDAITIESATLIASNQSVNLTITYNCTTDFTFEFESTDIPIELTSTDFSLTTALPDGIYNFVLEITNVGGDLITERDCLFMNCSSTCLMLDTYKALSDTDKDVANAALIKVLSFEALLLADSCSSCSCSSLCDLYNATGLNTDFNVTDCGCQ